MAAGSFSHFAASKVGSYTPNYADCPRHPHPTIDPLLGKHPFLMTPHNGEAESDEEQVLSGNQNLPKPPEVTWKDVRVMNDQILLMQEELSKLHLRVSACELYLRVYGRQSECLTPPSEGPEDASTNLQENVLASNAHEQATVPWNDMGSSGERSASFTEFSGGESTRSRVQAWLNSTSPPSPVHEGTPTVQVSLATPVQEDYPRTAFIEKGSQRVQTKAEASEGARPARRRRPDTPTIHEPYWNQTVAGRSDGSMFLRKGQPGSPSTGEKYQPQAMAEKGGPVKNHSGRPRRRGPPPPCAYYNKNFMKSEAANIRGPILASRSAGELRSGAPPPRPARGPNENLWAENDINGLEEPTMGFRAGTSPRRPATSSGPGHPPPFRSHDQAGFQPGHGPRPHIHPGPAPSSPTPSPAGRPRARQTRDRNSYSVRFKRATLTVSKNLIRDAWRSI